MDGEKEIDRCDLAAEPLLGEDHSVTDCLEEEYKKPTHGLRWIWLIHGAMMVTYSAFLSGLFLLNVDRSAPCDKGDKGQGLQTYLRLPSREGLQWEDRQFETNIVDNPFAGPPREEVKNAWHDLLKNDNIRVPIGYFNEKNLTSVCTKDHAEGIASLSVYHSLHCLKKVKRMMFKENYYADKDETAMPREVKHADHCVEYIRESLMCQPDLSLVTFRWINNTAQHEDPIEFYPTNFDVDVHRCANWQHLD